MIYYNLFGASVFPRAYFGLALAFNLKANLLIII